MEVRSPPLLGAGARKRAPHARGPRYMSAALRVGQHGERGINSGSKRKLIAALSLLFTVRLAPGGALEFQCEKVLQDKILLAARAFADVPTPRAFPWSAGPGFSHLAHLPDVP